MNNTLRKIIYPVYLASTISLNAIHLASHLVPATYLIINSQTQEPPRSFAKYFSHEGCCNSHAQQDGLVGLINNPISQGFALTSLCAIPVVETLRHRKVNKELKRLRRLEAEYNLSKQQ